MRGKKRGRSPKHVPYGVFWKWGESRLQELKLLTTGVDLRSAGLSTVGQISFEESGLRTFVFKALAVLWGSSLIGEGGVWRSPKRVTFLMNLVSRL